MRNRLSALALSVMCAIAVSSGEAAAAAKPFAQIEAEREARVAALTEAVELYHRAALEHAPGLAEPLIDYADIKTVEQACIPGATGRTHAILIGADDIGVGERFKLKGPANDVELLATVLGQRGVDAERIHLVEGDAANREGVRTAFLSVLDALRCDDRVIVHFSGHGETVQGIVGMLEKRVGEADPDAAVPSPSELIRGLADDRVSLDPPLTLFGDVAFGQDGPSDLLILLNDDSKSFNELMLGRDVSEYMVAVRNKGAHAIAVLDVVSAAAADLQARQREAGEASSWRFEYVSGAQEPVGPSSNTLVPGHGGYAAFYAAGTKEVTPELLLPRRDPDARKYGLFTYRFAEAIIARDTATPRTIAEAIQSSYDVDGRRRPHPRIESSDPDLVLVAEARRAQAGESPIRILSPTPKRGAMAVERQEVTIEGIVEWPSRALGVHVGTQPANLDAEGRFSATVPLDNGMNTVTVVAVTADSRMHRHTMDFIYEGDRKALEGEGRRIAVVIANQNYGAATGFASLATPFADAEALTALLTDKYGFETEIRSANGAVVSLILKDPTKRDIEIALHHVGRTVGDKDTVLMFYAGHGIFEPVTSTAYWVPADAEAGFAPSYLSAADISAAIQRMQAGSVIMISDSCYSGALIRGGGGERETIDDEIRTQALLRMQARRSRVVITSGNNEPVEDLGGQGHSIFARALLTGLEKMEHEAFSARELFDGYILQAVTANADQEPQYRPLEKVGHEGGDFVFVKMLAAVSAEE